MKIHLKLAIPVCLCGVFMLWIAGSSGAFIPNLSEECYRCLCYVPTKCDLAHGCTGGYCGPYNISKVYWVDSGKIVLPDDEPVRDSAWKDCAKNYNCARRIIEGYLEKFGTDCNNDGVTNCFDYMMVNANGGFGCSASLNQTAEGREMLQRYKECKL